MNVHGGVLAKEDAVWINEKKTPVGVERTENFAGVSTDDAREKSTVDIWLDYVDESTCADVEALPIDDGGL